ncbi:S8 family peptidase [Corynebacterium renale]|uniref:S8 family peptidase n=1 Tax=Corynebacterium renale TaxID=1724 RepID=UPI00069D41C3|nr:S8 family peptidase [Corynebacterium renale]
MKEDLEIEEVRTRSDGTVVVEVDEVLDPVRAENFMDEMRSSGDVEYIEPDAIMQPFALNDEFYNLQWHFHGEFGGRVEQAWEAASNQGEGVTVAVVDSGYAYHPDLDGNIVPGLDFISDPNMARDGNGRDNDPTDEGDWTGPYQCGNNGRGTVSSWHGTHVAGTVAAQAGNGIGVAGVAPRAKVQPLRALAACGGYTSDIADAVLWASGAQVKNLPINRTPAQVINMSLGGQGVCSRTYQEAINEARSRGSVVVVAAGNERQNAGNVQPANCDGVITVGASGESGAVASYSNYGHVVDITAPGGDFRTDRGILSTLNSGQSAQGRPNFAYYQGTSMATPFVSGIIANMLSENRNLSPDEIENILKDTARPMSNCQGGCGAGLINGGAAVEAISGGPKPTPKPGPEPTPEPEPAPGLDPEPGPVPLPEPELPPVNDDEPQETGRPVPPVETKPNPWRPREWSPWDLLDYNSDGTLPDRSERRPSLD